MSSKLVSLLLWALAAGCAVAWGLQLSARGVAVPDHARLAGDEPPTTGLPLAALERLLGRPAVAAVAPAAGPGTPAAAASRFRLLGVVAPRQGAVRQGVALIAVDNLPPRALRLGQELEPGLRLVQLDHRRASLGASADQIRITLELPELAAAQRGVPGQAAVATPAIPVLPGIPGMPGAVPGMVPGRMPVSAPQPGVPAIDQVPAAGPVMGGGPRVLTPQQVPEGMQPGIVTVSPSDGVEVQTQVEPASPADHAMH